MYTVAHLTDLHLDGGTTSRIRFERTVAYLRQLKTPVDCIVLTGDIIEAGAIEEYRTVAEALAGDIPVLSCPGNSDQRAALRAALLPSCSADAHDTELSLDYARTVGDLTIIMLDSSVPGQYYGELSAATLRWLAGTLAALPAAAPVLIALHHPPIALGHPVVDQLRLRNADDLAAIVRRYPNVIALLAGHTHAGTATLFAGRPFLVAPGVHSGLHLPWERVAEGQSLIDDTAPPALALHRIDDQYRITSYFRALP